MKSISKTNPLIGSVIYQGLYDISKQGKLIEINFQDDRINIDIDNVITIGNPVVKNLSIQEIMFLCSELKLVCEIFPNNNSHFSNIINGKTIYLSLIRSLKEVSYLLCLSFTEKQPSLYEAELIGLFNLDK